MTSMDIDTFMLNEVEVPIYFNLLCRPLLDSINHSMQDMKEGRDACGKLHDNLSLIFSELDRIYEGKTLSEEILDLYHIILLDVKSYLQKYGQQSVKDRIDNFESMKSEMKDFIERINKLVMEIKVEGLDEMKEWEKNWGDAIANLCGDEGLLVEVLEVQSTHKNIVDSIKNLQQQNQQQGEILTKTLISIIMSDLSSGNHSQQKIANKWTILLLAGLIKDPPSALKDTVFDLFMQLSDSYDNAKNFEDINTIKILIECLQSGTITQQLYIATTLRNLTQNCIEIRKLIVQVGGINPLVKMLESETSEHKLQAAITLWILVVNNDNKLLICEAGAERLLTQLVQLGHEDKAIPYANEILWHLSNDDYCREHSTPSGFPEAVRQSLGDLWLDVYTDENDHISIENTLDSNSLIVDNVRPPKKMRTC